jgi:hypothetical protein
MIVVPPGVGSWLYGGNLIVVPNYQSDPPANQPDYGTNGGTRPGCDPTRPECG